MKTVLYNHGGSFNRGCEAIVRTTVDMLSSLSTEQIAVFSAHPEEDTDVALDKLVNLIKNPVCSIPGMPSWRRIIASIWNRLTGSERLYFTYCSKPFIKYDFKDTLAIHIGGDHYCYEGGEKMHALYNEKIRTDGGISILWGASVEPYIVKKKHVRKDMTNYNHIFVRESISFEALKEIGVTNITLCPDPAFTLPFVETEFSKGMSDNTVGINFSPYALGNNDIGMQNYRNLIFWLQKNTNMDILLIPHVFKNHSNDPKMLEMLYNSLEDRQRVKVITQKYNCCELKGIIKRCRLYIGARTHSTIAAYSTCVPTLVLGYSVKAKGIAKDIFSSFENYVVSVQELNDNMELVHKFQWLLEHEKEIRNHLNEIMPEYIKRAYKGADVLKHMLKTKDLDDTL